MNMELTAEGMEGTLCETPICLPPTGLPVTLPSLPPLPTHAQSSAISSSVSVVFEMRTRLILVTSLRDSWGQ